MANADTERNTQPPARHDLDLVVEFEREIKRTSENDARLKRLAELYWGHVPEDMHDAFE